MTTTTTTRRAILAGATALATGAAVNVAATLTSRADQDSARHLDPNPILAAPCPLIAAYERALLAYAETYVVWARLHMAGQRTVDLKYGPAQRPVLEAPGFSFDDWKRDQRTRSRRLDREWARVGYRPVARELEKLHEEIRVLDGRLDDGELDDADPMTLLRARALSATFEGFPVCAYYQAAWTFEGGSIHDLWSAAVDATGLGPLVDKVDDILRAGATKVEEEAVADT